MADDGDEDTLIEINSNGEPETEKDPVEKELQKYEKALDGIWKEEEAPRPLRDHERSEWYRLRESWKSRDKAHGWDQYGLGQRAVKSIFEEYFDVRQMRLNPGNVTHAYYEEAKRKNKANLGGSLVSFYDTLIAKLEEIVPDPWARKDEGTKTRERPAPV